jgi:thiol:disulfide interchange protein DsbC
VNKLLAYKAAKDSIRFGLQPWLLLAAPWEEKAILNIFTDTSCPYYKQLHSEIMYLQQAGISVHYLPYPRDGNQGPGYLSLRQGWCAGDRAEAMTIAKGLDTANLPTGDCKGADLVDDGYALGKLVGVTGTPSLYKSNGENIQDYVPYEERFKEFLIIEAKNDYGNPEQFHD